MHDAATTFDAELVPILPAVWYSLHLPATRFEMLDIPMVGIRESFREKRRHLILLVPSYVLGNQAFLSAVAREGEPILILSDDEHFEEAVAASKKADFALPPVRVSDLNEETLRHHWQLLSDHWGPEWPAGVKLDAFPPQWSSEVSTDGSALPLRRLLKSLGQGQGAERAQNQAGFADAFNLLRWRAISEALAGLEERGVGRQEAELRLDEEIAAVTRRLRVPMTLSLPGVAPRYRRLVHQAAETAMGAGNAALGTNEATRQSRIRPAETVSADPPEVLKLMVAHNAAGDNSLGLVFPDPVPDDAFVALADLERYWVDSARSTRGAQPRKEARLRARLDQTMQAFWTDETMAAVRSASQIEAFTNFPIGLLRMPGHTAPLSALIPIAYRPINPLTRAFQIEFAPDRVVDLSRGMRVLVVECIPHTDPVGQISRAAWSLAGEELSNQDRSVFVDFVEAANKEEVALAVAAHEPNVLVLSAHGVYDADSNMAGLAIGSEVSMGDDLGPMPPMVILSACHSGPRGAGPVSVADILLWAGARTVLSTLVPVDVRHNSAFMTRLLLYMSESIGGVESHISFLDLWHRVQTNTVILDVLYGNPRLLEWGHSKEKGTPPIVEFMSKRSTGRIRPWRLYEDVEAVLLEIAAERGDETAVRGWLRSPGYIPESMMYTVVGDPSCIRFQSPQLITPRQPVAASG
ncbi:CHAT domain-containing protein [Citricoccus sp. I39-566]|uniref:CHAT domain-containing protein n=1 Tax=Citricoccus sp. I39-566 TaxID=3073268 RepID=UPI00286C6C5A|nr:CHAT domain-containing protein [Citricoccus sp. I39-566]WMY79410.1 CHAT domain-containing protein [Citricoccus sp. I39-566]